MLYLIQSSTIDFELLICDPVIASPSSTLAPTQILFNCPGTPDNPDHSCVTKGLIILPLKSNSLSAVNISSGIPPQYIGDPI